MGNGISSWRRQASADLCLDHVKTILLVAFLTGASASAFGQKMPVGPAVAPPHVAPPPAPAVTPAAPTVTPVTPTIPTPKTPVVTAPVIPSIPTASPAPGTSSGEPRAAGFSERRPVFDRWGNQLAGIPVTWWTPNGPRQAVSDASGTVTLGRLPEGVHEITVSTRSAGVSSGGNQSSPQEIQAVLIALLLPAVQKVGESAHRVLTHPVKTGPDVHVRLGVGPDGKVTSVDWGDGTRVAVGDVNGDGVPELKAFEDLAKHGAPGETRIAFASSSPGNGGTGGTGGVGSPQAMHGSTWLVGVLADVAVNWSGPGGRGRAVPDAKGIVPLGRLPKGTYDVAFEIPRTGGTQPTQQRILIGLLLPAIQKVRGIMIPFGAKGSVKFTVGADGNVTNANWYVNGGVTHEDTWEQQRLKGAPSGVGGDTTFVFFDVNNVIAEVSTQR